MIRFTTLAARIDRAMHAVANDAVEIQNQAAYMKGLVGGYWCSGQINGIDASTALHRIDVITRAAMRATETKGSDVQQRREWALQCEVAAYLDALELRHRDSQEENVDGR